MDLLDLFIRVHHHLNLNNTPFSQKRMKLLVSSLPIIMLIVKFVHFIVKQYYMMLNVLILLSIFVFLLNWLLYSLYYITAFLYK